jgi:hypothetical protein
MNQDQSMESLRREGVELWNLWAEMFNGDAALARRLVAARFVLHLPTPSGVDISTVQDPAAVERWVTRHRAKYRRLVFHTGCGPFVDPVAKIVAGPWHAEARTGDAERWVCGMDTIAFRDGKITEYWTLSKEVDAVGAWSTQELR